MSASFPGVKEAWLIDFENEEINDERWSCLVSAVVESKPDDEECLKMFSQFVTSGKAPIIRIVSMSDVVGLFKPSTESKKKEETKVKEKPKLDNIDASSLLTRPPPRFPEIVAHLSKYAIVSDGSCKLSPELMAYALKYIVLCLKDQDYFQRKVARAARRRNKEAEVKAEVLKMLKGGPRERVNANVEEANDSWQRDRFDIFGNPLKDGPFLGPELYIVLHDFYDPFVFPELQKLKVPFRAVIKIENFRPVNGKPISGAASKRSDLVNNFWKLQEGNVSNGGMDDIALVKYIAPDSDVESIMDISAEVAKGLIAVLYSVFNVCRLHQTYIQQMKVQRMVRSLEILNLSKCVVYNELCDALVAEDANAEIFVLFSIIEQVVAGVPETDSTALEYEAKPSNLFQLKENLFEEMTDTEERHEPVTPQLEKRLHGRTAAVYFYDDKISLAALSIDSNILKASDIFDRFVINSISSKIRSKFVRLPPSLRAQSDFSFFQMWLNSKEDKNIFRVKLSFLVIMRLFERIRAFNLDCGSVLSQSQAFLSPSESIGDRKTSSGQSLIQNEPQNLALSRTDTLFYKQLKAPSKNLTTSSVVTREVRRAEGILGLQEESSVSDGNLELACGRCPKLDDLPVDDKPMDQQIKIGKLEQFLESHEITNLNDRNLLADRKKFEAFVEKQNFYETFEPNRTVQKLQELYDHYNTIEYTYFSPVDTLFVLGHNDADFRGVYHSNESAFITSPLSLRDFVSHVLPENKKWMATVNGKYIKFLKAVQMKMADEEKRRDHEFRCGLLKVYKEMTESERRRFLDDILQGGGTESGLDTKKGVKEKVVEVPLMQDLEDLPVKTRQKRPDVKFFGVNCGRTRTQVNVVNYEFHSQDGSTVGVKTRSWLYGSSVVSLTIQRLDCRLIVHRWIEGSDKRLMLFRDPSGILVTFSSDCGPFPVKITQPNGLIIEIGRGGIGHVKQTYLKQYRWGEDIKKEKCRCCLQDGSVVIFRVDGGIDVLCPSGTKHGCCRSTSGGGQVEIYDTLTPTGELWVRDDCSKCKRMVNLMTVITGRDNQTNETYFKREDGTSFMLWPDGKLVTTYPDGTKISTTPKFEVEELMLETEEESSVTSAATSKPRISFADEQLPEDSTGFTVVACSYLIEHPHYATVFSDSLKLEIRILGKLNVEMSSTKSLRIECRHSVLSVSAENADFYTVCGNCGKRSFSRVFLDSGNIFSKSEDYFGQRFYVYSSGQILHKTAKENSSEEEEEECEKFGDSPSRGQPSGNCEYHKSTKSQGRCLAIERDLTGLEFIDMDTLHHYHGSLSPDAYYDLGRLSGDKTQLQHSFFNPVYRIGREKYIMNYEKNDGFPTRLTRKNLMSGSAVKCEKNSVRKTERRKLPKTTIVRFIRVLRPDPITVMKEMTKEIAIYQRRSLDMLNKYDKLSKKGKQGLFARYIAKELELIASTLCPSLKLYPHTCSLTPYTEIDIHSAAHSFDRINYFLESNPDDCRTASLPRCKRIPKPLKHSGNDKNIPEVAVLDDNDGSSKCQLEIPYMKPCRQFK